MQAVIFVLFTTSREYKVCFECIQWDHYTQSSNAESASKVDWDTAAEARNFVAMDLEFQLVFLLPSVVCVTWSKLIDFENSISDRPTQQFNKRKNAIKRLFWALKAYFWRWRIIVITDWIYGSGGSVSMTPRKKFYFWEPLKSSRRHVTILEYLKEINVIFGSTSIDIRSGVVVFPPTKSNSFRPVSSRTESWEVEECT